MQTRQKCYLYNTRPQIEEDTWEKSGTAKGMPLIDQDIWSTHAEMTLHLN